MKNATLVRTSAALLLDFVACSMKGPGVQDIVRTRLSRYTPGETTVAERRLTGLPDTVTLA